MKIHMMSCFVWLVFGLVTILPLPAEVTKMTTIDTTIAVPENRSASDSRTLELPYRVIKARPDAPPLPPLYLLDGGPGSPNVNDYMVLPDLVGTRDIVIVGYRGVDGSTKLDSVRYTERFVSLVDDELSDGCLDKIADLTTAWVKEQTAKGIDLRGYGIADVVADIEAVRKQLGQTIIDIYAISYGTRLAWLYSRTYPGIVHRMVLLGENPPGHFAVPPAEVQAVVDRYSTLWKTDLTTPVASVSRSMPRSWLWWPIHAGALKTVAQTLLFNPDQAPTIFSAYEKAANGDASSLAGLSMLVPFALGGQNMGDLIMKGSADFEPERDYRAETSNPDQIGRAFMRVTFGMIQAVPDSTLSLIPPRIDQRTNAAVPTETLILGGTLDASTPLDWVKRDYAAILPNSHLVVLQNFGHGNFPGVRPGEMASIIENFLDQGGVPNLPIADSIPSMKPQLDGSSIAWGATIGTGVVLTGVVVGFAYLISGLTNH